MPSIKVALNIFDGDGGVYALPSGAAAPDTWEVRPDGVAADTRVSNPELQQNSKVSVDVPGAGRIVVPDSSLDWAREIDAITAMKKVLTLATDTLKAATPDFDFRKDRPREVEGLWALLSKDGESVILNSDTETVLHAKHAAGFTPFAIDRDGKQARPTTLQDRIAEIRRELQGLR